MSLSVLALRRIVTLSSAIVATLLALLLSAPIAVALSYTRALISTGTLPALESAQVVVSAQLTEDAVGLALGITASSGALLAVLLFHVWRDRARREWTIARAPSRPRTLVAASAAMFGVSISISTSMGMLGLESPALDLLRTVFDRAGPLGRLALVPIIGGLAGVSEELFFRGMILDRLRRVHSDAVAIGVSSALFGLMHLDPLHAVAATAMGVLLGIVAVREGTIVPGIVAHVVNNAIVTLVPGIEGDEYQWPQLACGAILLGLGVHGLRKIRPSQK